MSACRHLAEGCPGCPAFDVSIDVLAARKSARVTDALIAQGPPLPAAPIAPAFSPPGTLGYRTRAKWTIDEEGRIGLFREGTHEVLDLADCLIVSPAIASVATTVRSLFAARTLAACRPGALVAIDLRDTADADVIVSFSEARESTLLAAARTELADTIMRAHPHVRSVAFGRRLVAQQSLARELEVVRGPSVVRDRIGLAGVPHDVAHGSFVQAHRETAAALHHVVIDRIARVAATSTVLELHAGSGALGLALAQAGHRVTAVELYAPAITRANGTARREHLDDRYRALALDVDDALASPDLGGDVVLVNPPRKGLSTDTVRHLAARRPSLLAYVACDPETLARDLAQLTVLGLGLEDIRTFDMMPRTDEVETLAFLVPASPPAPTILFENDSFMAASKLAGEPTTPHPEYPSSLLERVRTLHPEAVPVHRLDVGTSGVCLFAKRPDLVAPIARGLADGEKQYTALARGIVHAKGTIRLPITEDGKKRSATTRYRRVAVVGGHSLLTVRPEEGRQHQIRKHLASIDHALLGDTRYGHVPSNRHLIERHALARPFLHCARIHLALDGVPPIEAPLPGDLTLTLARLGRRRGDAVPPRNSW